MKCPVDGTTLAITHRDGIEIDYCPQCRGVWLDRGELDKLIERAAEREGYAPHDDEYPYKRKNDDDYHRPHPYGKKRKSFLGEMFDIFD